MTGHAAVTVPVGWTDDGLPVGSQLIGPHLDDAVAIEASAAYEAATRYDRYFPDAWGPRSGDSALAPRAPNRSGRCVARGGLLRAWNTPKPSASSLFTRPRRAVPNTPILPGRLLRGPPGRGGRPAGVTSPRSSAWAGSPRW
jgi:hypothetical protein